MEQNKNIPAIRFNGFEEKWKKKKLGDVANIIGGGTPSTSVKEYWNGDINWFSPTEIGDNIYAYDSSKKISKLGLEKSSAKILPANRTILFTSRAGIGDMAILKIDAATNQGFQSLVVNNGFDVYFIFSLGKSIKTKAIIKASGSTFLEISGKTLGLLNFKFPILPEQTQIGNFFKTLDGQINAQEQKHQKLINLKKAMLEKMFPKEAADVPEIRFNGFTEKWEEKSLNEYLEVSKDKNKSLDYTKNDVLSVSGEFGIVNQIAFQGRSFAGASVANYGIVNKGNIVYTKSPLKSNPYGIIKSNQFQTGIVSTLYAVYKCKSNVDDCFVEYYFTKDDRLNKYLKPLVSKGAKNDMKVSDENALKGKVIFPSSYEEQLTISRYFLKLDNLIIISNNKIQKFKNIKQALLQKMFV